MTYLIIALALLLSIVGAWQTSIRSRRQRLPIPLRKIDGYEMMKGLADESMETGGSLHVSFGSSAIRNDSSIAALAASEVFYALSQRSLLGDRRIVATLSDPITLTLAQDVLRKAYLSRAEMVAYQDTQIRWFPAGDGSLALGAAGALTMQDEGVSGSVLVGRFGPELMFMGEQAARVRARMIAVSDRLEGQAAAYAVSDTVMLSEELYVSKAYLNPDDFSLGGVLAQDILRYLVIAIMIVLAISACAGRGG